MVRADNDNGRAYYNEIDPFAAAWLRELIKANLIAPGDVDERSIVDVRPSDLAGYTQCHFFAGIGVWSYSLRKAGWSDGRQVWTGSCPCQPFSDAGKGEGFNDERHLWPHWHWLIKQCQPNVVFGEQVASKNGLAWFDLVSSDMEGEGYAIGAVDTCSAGSGAPHIRQRLRFVATRGVGLADAPAGGWREERADGGGRSIGDSAQGFATRLDTGGATVGLAVSDCREFEGQSEFRGAVSNRQDYGWSQGGGEPQSCGNDNGMAHANGGDTGTEGVQRSRQHGQRTEDGLPVWGGIGGFGYRTYTEVRPSPTNGFWSNPDWLFCRDGKWRPVESGTFPLAHGAPARVGRLRGYGNAVDAEATRIFIEAYKGAEGMMSANDNHLAKAAA